MKSFFTPKEVAKLIGISYRQIQYWDKTNFIKPSYRRRGKYRLYTFADLIQLKVAKVLRETNISIQRLRKIIKSLKSLLPQVSHPLVDLTFLIEGERILVFNGVVLMSSKTVNNYVRFDVKSLREEIDRTFPDLYALPDEDDAKRSVA
jgi:DNA-binding transcriptional MerR regulator